MEREGRFLSLTFECSEVYGLRSRVSVAHYTKKYDVLPSIKIKNLVDIMSGENHFARVKRFVIIRLGLSQRNIFSGVLFIIQFQY